MRNASVATLIFRFFVPYALILLGSLLVGWFAYHKTSALVESETMKSNGAALGQIREALDRRFAEVETIAEQMSSESKIQSFQFVKAPYRDTNPYRLWDLEKSLFDYRMSNHFIVDYYIAYKNSGMFISPRKVYNARQFYSLQLHYDDITYDDWYNQLFGTYYYKTYMPGMPVTYEGKSYSVVSYMQSFGTKDSGGVITVLINNKQIQEMLQNIDSEQGGFAYVADQNGNLISQVGMDPDFNQLKALPVREGFSQIHWNGQRMLITRTTSGYNGWSYVSAQPESVVLEKANYIKELTLTVFILALVAGLFVAALLAYRSSRPVFKMLQLLPLMPGANRKRPPLGNLMDDIRSSVSALVESHDALNSRLDEQLPLLRSVFFDRLLQGGFTSKEEAEAAMEHSRIEISGDLLTVAVIQLRGYHAPYNEAMLMELDIVKLRIRDVISAIGPEEDGSIQIHDLGENKLALLFHGEGRSRVHFMEAVKQLLNKLYGSLREASNAGLLIAVGTCQTRLTEVYRSHGEAEFLLLHAAWSDQQPILYYDDAEVPVPAYFYPFDVEQRLIQLVRSGNKPETARLIDQIREKNGEAAQAAVVQRLLAQELCGTLMKCCEPSGTGEAALNEEVEVVLKASDPALPPPEVLHMLFHALLDLCQKQEDRKRSHNNSLAGRLIEYIDRHYSDPDLSLSVLAGEAGNSEAYVSYFFKEQTGMNFSDYLEHVRMGEAKRLLLHGGMPVSEIAGLTGYLSLNTFSRAFKRANGMSATEFRKQQQVREA